MNGLLVVDKPAGWSSRDAVNHVQRLIPRRTRIGHTGTLDPLATGVLVLCLGAATKLADRIQALPKTYATRVRLGAGSTTDDANGFTIVCRVESPPPLASVEQAVAAQIGVIQQVPPVYSAIKVNGRRSYRLARAGQRPELAARLVRIDSIRIITYQWPNLDLVVECGKGTYIRGIARDLGLELQVGGLVQELRRTTVGPFSADTALTFPCDAGTLQKEIIPIEDVLRLIG